jgi:hypothetical protein
MRFMMLVKADEKSEAGMLPSRELVEAMGKFNEEMVRAGVMLAGEGLHPSSKGARVSFSGGKSRVTEGPFGGTRDLLAGFWMIQVKSREEAIAWAARAPFEEGGVIEIRQVFEVSDFPAEVLPAEEAAREQAMRKELERRGRAR